MRKLQTISIALIWLIVTMPIAIAQENETNTTAPEVPIEIRNITLVFENERTLINWETNIATTSGVEFGRTIALDNKTSDAGLVTNHSISVATKSGSEYFYRITSCDAGGNCKAAPTQKFFAGKLFVFAEIPRYSKSKSIDIIGKTRPGATVSVSLNSADVRKSVTPKGDFVFREVQLATGTSNITLLTVLGPENATFSAITEVDSEPASMNVTLPPTATVQPITANVTVSEAVNLTITVKPTGEPPLRPGGLLSDKIESNKVPIKWSEVSNSLEYAVYRDGNRLATTSSPEYIDSGVSPGKTYQYQVSAVAKNCVEGDKSDLLTAATPNGTARPDTFEPVKLSCAQEPLELFLRQGRASVSVPLREGENLVEFRAIDKASYVTIVEARIVHDVGPPRFIETNLRQLSPAYVSLTQGGEVIVKGKLSEAGSVTAIVNGKPAKTVLTDADGLFSVPVKLERSAKLQATATKVVGQVVWTNKVQLKASDGVGLTAETPEELIDLQQCGTGTKLQVQLSNPAPEILNPRMLSQGVQTLGLSFTYKYSGGQTATIDKNQVKVIPVALSPDVEKEYDNKLVRFTNKPLGVRSLQKGKKNEGTGYIQFTFNAIDNPWEQLHELKDEKEPANATTFAKSEAIANHRKGRTKFTKDPTALPQTSGCLVPGFGCMKLFFELEIPYQETTGPLSTDPLVRQTQETTKTKTEFQRTCLAIEVPIDIPIPPRYIPKGLLQATAEILTAIIEGIDKLLKPIETVGKYMFYTCLAGQAITLVPIFMEKYRCEFSSVFTSLSNEGKFNVDFATIGACADQYSGTDQEQSKENCGDCQYWKETRLELDFFYKRLCDRVMCPSAPSLQFYLKQNANQQVRPISEALNTAAAAKYKADGYYMQDGKHTVGNDCAAWMKDPKYGKKGQSPTAARQPPRLFFPYEKVKEIYTDWLNHQDDDDTDEGQVGGKINCDSLHPAAPECCGYTYMEEWSSACGLGTFNFADTYDEIKESTCLSAQKAGQSNFTVTTSGTSPTTSNVECGNVLNSLGGFCQPDGSAPPEPIKAVQTCCETAGTPTGVRAATAGAKENYLYILLLPRSAQTAAPQGATTGEYDVRIGTIQESVQFDRSGAAGTTRTDQRHRVNTNLEAIELDSTAVQAYFTAEKIDKYNQDPNSLNADYPKFAEALCDAAGYKGADMARCGAKDQGRALYDQVMAIMGTPDQEYIIRPGDGLVNSLRCVCIPTLVAFLKRWRNILAAVRDCMSTILLTGDGSSGVCQAVVSQHACDLLYDAIACFTQKFSKPSGGRAVGTGGIGNIMGALTATGTELSRSAESRYGESSVYKQLFVDKKLVHSICLFAFTGTWNLDVDALIDTAIASTPTRSQGIIPVASRRFAGFNPATRPSGLVSWQYQIAFGLYAGANIENIELVLKCSGGYKCRDIDGFDRGKCDCETPKEIVVFPEDMPTTAKNGEIVNKELFQIIDGAPGDGQIRYDKVYVRWSWNDGKQVRQDKTEEFTISTDGPGATPGECRFDPLSLAFRCAFGESGDAIQFLDATVRAPRSIPQPVFVLDEAIDVELRIRQVMQTVGGVTGGKHLQYIVKNNQGREVAKNERLLQLSRTGDYTINTKEDFGTSPRVTTSWFGSGGTTGAGRDISQWSSVRNPQTSSPASDVVEQLSVLDGTREWTGQFAFVVQITRDAQGELYQLFSAGSPPSTSVNVAGGFTKGSPLPGTSSGRLGREILYTASTAQSSTAGVNVRLPEIKLRLARAPLGLDQGETRQYLVNHGAPTVTNPCDAQRTTPQAFTVTFTAYDSDNFGQPMEQPSIDPATDDNVVKTVNFNAVCGNTAEIASKVTATQTAGIASQMQRIIEILLPLAAAQRSALVTFNEVVSTTSVTSMDEAQRQIARRRLLQTLQDATERYAITQRDLEVAVKNFNDEFAKATTIDQNRIKTAKDAIDKFMTPAELPGSVTAIAAVRDQVVNLENTPLQTAPPVEKIKEKADAAKVAIAKPNTEATINEIQGFVGSAAKVYQIFDNNPVWTYDDSQAIPKIIFHNPAGGPKKEWQYATGERIFKSIASTSNVYWTTSQVFTALVFHENIFYEITYRDNKAEKATIYTTAGEARGELQGNHPTIVRISGATERATITDEFMKTIRAKVQAMGGTVPLQAPPTLTGVAKIFPNAEEWTYNQGADLIIGIVLVEGIPVVKEFYYDTTKGVYKTKTAAGGTFGAGEAYNVVLLRKGVNSVDELYYVNDELAKVIVWDIAGGGTENTRLSVFTDLDLRSETALFKKEVLEPLFAPPPVPRGPECTDVSGTKRFCDADCTGYGEDSEISKSCPPEKPKCCTIPQDQYCEGPFIEPASGIRYTLECNQENTPLPVQSDRKCKDKNRKCFKRASTDAQDIQKYVQYRLEIDKVKNAAERLIRNYDGLIQTSDAQLALKLTGTGNQELTDQLNQDCRDALARFETTIRGLPTAPGPIIVYPAQVLGARAGIMAARGVEPLRSALTSTAETCVNIANDLGRPGKILTGNALKLRITTLRSSMAEVQSHAAILIQKIDDLMGATPAPVAPAPRVEPQSPPPDSRFTKYDAIQSRVTENLKGPTELTQSVGICDGYPCIGWLGRPSATSKCGDGKIDPGEACDWHENGRIIIRSDPPNKDTSPNIFFSTPDGTSIDVGSGQLYDYVSGSWKTYHTDTSAWVIWSHTPLTSFCNRITGQGDDCDDKVHVDFEKGACFDDCTTYMPLVSCYDTGDWIGNSGYSVFYGPRFKLGNTPPTIESSNVDFDGNYLWSTWNKGQPCVPDGKDALNIDDRNTYRPPSYKS